MNTNDIFSLNRFALYFKKTFTEDRRKYLLQMAAVAAGCIFVILFIALHLPIQDAISITTNTLPITTKALNF